LLRSDLLTDDGLKSISDFFLGIGSCWLLAVEYNDSIDLDLEVFDHLIDDCRSIGFYRYDIPIHGKRLGHSFGAVVDTGTDLLGGGHTPGSSRGEFPSQRLLGKCLRGVSQHAKDG